MSLSDLDLRAIPEWVTGAPCGADPSIFTNDKPTSADLRVAKAVCAACPVRDLCLAYALEHGETVGVWGGYTPTERQRIALGQPPEGPPLQPIAHGQVHGPRQHRARGIPLCDACRETERAYARELRAKKRAGRPAPARPALEPPPCGTRAAYDAHRRAGEPTCDKCRAWNAADLRERRATARAARAAGATPREAS